MHAVYTCISFTVSSFQESDAHWQPDFECDVVDELRDSEERGNYDPADKGAEYLGSQSDAVGAFADEFEQCDV